MPNSIKIMFMGTPDFAVPSLKALAEVYSVCAVFCQPDKVNGRGNRVVFGPVKEYAVENNIPVYQPETFKDNACLEILEKYDPDISVVAAYGKILPKYVLDYPKFGCINIHGSLLPKYRGASPIQASVLNGDSVTGITIMQMAEGLDSGDIIYTKELEIKKYETAGELFDRMSELSAPCILEAVELIISGNATYTKQDEELSSHVSMITKEMGNLDFKLSAKEVICRIYGLNPWPSAYIPCSFGNLKIHRAIDGNAVTAAPGTVISVSKKGIEVACGDNKSIVITEIQKPGKKKMDAHSFTLGCNIEVGTLITAL